MPATRSSILYAIAIEIVVWLVLVPLELARIALRRSTFRTLAERLGSIRDSSGAPNRRLLIHAVSAGEMNAASALVHELADRGWAFVISAGNEDARLTALRIQRHHPAVERVIAFPWDRRGAIDRWLRAISPDAVVVVETEIWPNLFYECRDRGIPLTLAGARVDPAAARWYWRLRRFFTPVLASASAILTVNAEERERYLAMGAPPERTAIGGSLKAGACLIAHESSDRRVRSRRVVVGASTHPGEEQLLVEACRQFDGHEPIELVLAPRHPRRAWRVRRLANAIWPEGAIEVVDRMGALSAIYSSANIAILGGTFADVGGHDIFEPARAGCAIVVGTFVDRIRGTVDAMLGAGAVRMTTAAELSSTIAELLTNDDERRRLSENARSFAAAQRKTAAEYADRIEQLVQAAKSRQAAVTTPFRIRSPLLTQRSNGTGRPMKSSSD